MTGRTSPDDRSRAAPVIGSMAALEPAPCRHVPARAVTPWVGAPGTTGTVAVIGAGKMGLTLVGQFLGHGWSVLAVDIRPEVVSAINAGRSHLDEPGLDELIRTGRRDDRLEATTDAGVAAAASDVVVLIVPVMLDPAGQPDRASMDAAVAAVGPGLHPGQLIVFETTLPIGDTRHRYTPRLEAASGLVAEDDLFVAFSPERLYSGDALRNLATYPKLVGGLGPGSTARAVAFYRSVIDAKVVAMTSAEAAEFAKLAETTYRDVNIALANEFAGVADRFGIDVQEVIAAANSQPYSHVHQPGIGVGGHCIPVYPRFLLAGGQDLTLVSSARTINDGQLGLAIDAIGSRLGDLRGVPILVLGLTYRAGVKELAYSQGPALVTRLRQLGAVVEAFDPLLDHADLEELGARSWVWGAPTDARAIVTQTADPRWQALEPSWFPHLEILVDGRNSLRDLPLPPTVAYRGFGVPRRTPGSGA